MYDLGLSHPETIGAPLLIVQRRSIKRGEILFAEGDISTALYEVHAGCFKTCVTSEAGHQQVSGFQIVGDFVGLEGLGAERQLTETVALEESQVTVIPISVLTQLSHDSADVQHRLHKIMSREGARAKDMMFLLGSMRAKERVATFLLDLLQRLSDRGYSPSEVNLCMTRDEIGSYLGLTLETVSRMFAKFKETGTLDVTSRNIRILNPEALCRAAAGLD